MPYLYENKNQTPEIQWVLPWPTPQSSTKFRGNEKVNLLKCFLHIVPVPVGFSKTT